MLLCGYHLLQVGTGPAGLITALSPAKNSIGVRIIDFGSRGIGIQVCLPIAMPGYLESHISFQPRTFELFQLQPIKTWDMFEKVVDIWPDRPYVSYTTILHSVC